MHVLRTILRPGWIALGVVVIAFAIACFTLLAPWQLGKNSSTQHRNDLISAAVDKDPVPIAQVAPGGGFDPSTEWREVLITGHFLPADQVLVRLRNVDEQPATEVVTPFAVRGGNRVIAVNRGFVRPVQGATPAVPPVPSGEVTIAGRIRAPEGTTAGRGAHRETGRLAVYSIDPAEIARATGTAMDPFYLQLSPGQPGSLGEIPLPQLDSGPYLSYGLQWLAFGIMAPLGAGYFLYSEIRQRRRARAATAPVDTTTQPVPATTAAHETPGTRSQRRRKVRHDLQTAAGSQATRSPATRSPATGVPSDPAPDERVATPRVIGSAPDAAGGSVDVRDKLSKRYGG